MKKHEHIVKKVQSGSIAEELGIEPGDQLLEIDGNVIEDIFDYQFYVEAEELVVLVEKPDGEQWEMEIEKEADEGLGIEFEEGLMDEYHSCHNKCIFCFIDQMPPGMRETLYFKDDDSRLSFLQGNYVTLTNMSDHDIDRIIHYHLGPINISFQTTNPDLRCKMLHNRFAGDVFPKIRRLADAGIELNGQIVLCRDINDGAELERSISDMTSYLPALRSVSVVPVGLSKYREGLYPLKPFDAQSAGEVIDLIESWQKKIYPQYGVHFVHASDEWYLLAGRPLPEEERYDGYLQLENGVGMLRLLKEEVEETLAEVKPDGETPKRRVSIATGRLAGPFLKELGKRIETVHQNVTLQIFEIRNDFFGESITVSGLITGQDLIAQLKDQDLGDELLLPTNMIRSGERVFLDDLTIEDAEEALGIPIRIVESGGRDLVCAVTGEE